MSAVEKKIEIGRKVSIVIGLGLVDGKMKHAIHQQETKADQKPLGFFVSIEIGLDRRGNILVDFAVGPQETYDDRAKPCVGRVINSIHHRRGVGKVWVKIVKMSQIDFRIDKADQGAYH
jgi:hypothetical protein